MYEYFVLVNTVDKWVLPITFNLLIVRTAGFTNDPRKFIL